MGTIRPFKRTCRQFTDNSYGNEGKSSYVRHKDFANSPEQYIRAFLLIQKDLQSLFDYVEPSDQNLKCYSYRIHELLLRTCVEVEANCRAILLENGYIKKSNLNMNDYKKINKSHHLSSYKVKLPLWYGKKSLRKPYKKWENGKSLPWFEAYNNTKHDRHEKFNQASFNNLIDSVCGLVVILSSQFMQEDFMPGETYITLDGSVDGMESAIGNYFRVSYPNDWPKTEQYDFSYMDINDINFTIQKFNYNI